MSEYRMVKTTVWADAWVYGLRTYEKTMWVYLLSNPVSDTAGIVEYSRHRFSVETGIDPETVERILSDFEAAGKIVRWNGRIALTNWTRHQSKSPKLVYGIYRVLVGYKTDFLELLKSRGFEIPYPLQWNHVLEPETNPLPKSFMDRVWVNNTKPTVVGNKLPTTYGAKRRGRAADAAPAISPKADRSGGWTVEDTK